jgi:hypothetical protein
MKKKGSSICILENNGLVLLGLRKNTQEDSLWNNLYGRFAGKLSRGKRFGEVLCFGLEDLKKSGIKIVNSKKRGTIRFFYPDKSAKEIDVYVAKAEGEAKGTSALTPKWFLQEEIPYDAMLPDGEYWLPFLLSGKNFKASFHFDEERNISHQYLEKVHSFDEE